MTNLDEEDYYFYNDDDYDNPCDTCPDADHCDHWEARFCCTLCRSGGNDNPDCDNCDPMDIQNKNNIIFFTKRY